MSRIGEFLLKRSLISQDQLVKAVTEQQKQGGILATHLVKLGFVTEEQLVSHLQREYRLPIVDPMSLEVTPQVIQLLPHALSNKHMVLGLNLAGSTLTIAMADPSNLVAVNEVKFVTGYDLRICLSTITSLRKAIDHFYEGGSAMREVLTKIESEDVEVVLDSQEIDLKELERATEEAPVVKLVNALLTDAIRKRASDIHVEPFEKMLRVRFRIDGVLYEIMKPPMKLKNALVSRLKIMSSLDIAERRLPQDGRIKLRLPDSKEMDFRVSTVPTIFGEKVVLRLLDKQSLQLDMTKLGFEKSALADFKEAIDRPYGMVLVTGPTGSGKTTTLYSALSELNQISDNISTVEDPVEYNLVGVNQVQINDSVGLTFAASLRSFLRQDPDVIMVGEIRDLETAEIAVKAALTGHLVLSTLHTNDAPATISRLLNMGIEPFLVSSSLNLVLAQRLARVICKECRQEVEYPEDALLGIGFSHEEIATTKFFHGKGCEACANTGYRGRVALYEVLPIRDEIREAILGSGSALDIKRTAISLGMKTLRDAGLNKVREGATTVEEILRVTVSEGS